MYSAVRTILAGCTFACCTSLLNAAELILPLSFDDHSLPTTVIELNGEKCTLMFDMGSALGLHLSRESVGRINGASFTGVIRRSIDMAGEVHRNEQFTIDRMRIGDIEFKNVEGVELTPWGLVQLGGEGLPESPVIGLGFFDGKQLLIDYAAAQLTVADGSIQLSQLAATGWTEIPFKRTAEGLILKATVAGRKEELALDTGATLSMVAASRVVDTSSAVPCSTVYPELTQEGCQFIPVQAKFGNMVSTVYALLMDSTPDGFSILGLLGGDFLQHHSVLVDFAAGRMFLRPAEPRAYGSG